MAENRGGWRVWVRGIEPAPRPTPGRASAHCPNGLLQGCNPTAATNAVAAGAVHPHTLHCAHHLFPNPLTPPPHTHTQTLPRPGMASVALVLSILVPQVGNWWYGLTALSPAAYAYYMQRGTRPEQVGGGRGEGAGTGGVGHRRMGTGGGGHRRGWAQAGGHRRDSCGGTQVQSRGWRDDPGGPVAVAACCGACCAMGAWVVGVGGVGWRRQRDWPCLAGWGASS